MQSTFDVETNSTKKTQRNLSVHLLCFQTRLPVWIRNLGSPDYFTSFLSSTARNPLHASFNDRPRRPQQPHWRQMNWCGGPVHFWTYTFDLAFKRSIMRKEVYMAMVKNWKDITAQKEEGRNREGKKTLSGMSFVSTGQGYCFLTAGWLRGVQSGPLIPIQKRGNSWGWHQSSPPTHTHTHKSWMLVYEYWAHTTAKEKQKAAITTLQLVMHYPTKRIPEQDIKHIPNCILSHKKYNRFQ